MTSSQKNILKARELYLTKGVLKRELLRDEIVYSWVRARLVNLDFNASPQASIPDNTDLNRTHILDSLFLQDYGVDPNTLNLKAMFVVKANGEIENAWRSDPAERFYFNLSEDSIGTSGIGLALKNNKKTYVSGYEHYHQYFVDTITVGIPTSEDRVIGLILDNNSDSNETLRIIDKMPEKFEFSVKKEVDNIQVHPLENQPLERDWPSCLIGDSLEIQKARDRVSKLIDSQLIFISGPKGIGKESTANYIHCSRTEESSKFHAVYCDKIPLKRFEREWLEYSDVLFKTLEMSEIGTVYFENFDVLPNKHQRKLLRILDSKLVNTNSENNSYNRSVSFIMSLTRSVNQTIDNRRLTVGLQSRIKLAEIELPGLTHRREDVCAILGHMISKEVDTENQAKIIQDSNLFDNVSNLVFDKNLRDLDKIAREAIEKVSLNGTLTSTCVDEILSKYIDKSEQSNDLKSLSQIEREAIVRTLEALNFNMMRSASVLGISRSTLYRKLDQHKISIESVRN